MSNTTVSRKTHTIPETAIMLGISRNSCYALARKGEIPGLIRLGGKMVVSAEALERFLASPKSETAIPRPARTERQAKPARTERQAGKC